MNPSFPSPISTLVKADPVQRIAAAFIDGLVGYIPTLLLGIIDYRLAFIGVLIQLVYAFCKDALPEVSGFLGGQSIGKKLMNIKVVKEDTGTSIVGDYGTAITRQVSLIIPLFNIVDAFMIFSDNRKRFGDQWAKTMVVKA